MDNESQQSGSHFKIEVPDKYTVVDNQTGKKVINPEFYVKKVDETSFHGGKVREDAEAMRKKFEELPAPTMDLDDTQPGEVKAGV